MNAILSALSFLFERLELLKGDRVLSLLGLRQDQGEGYKAITSHGSTIEIFCKEVVYRVSYSNWWAVDKDIVMYHVYCACSNDIDKALKDKFNEDFVMARLLHPLISKVTQKKAVIDSYVSLILAKF